MKPSDTSSQTRCGTGLSRLPSPPVMIGRTRSPRSSVFCSVAIADSNSCVQPAWACLECAVSRSVGSCRSVPVRAQRYCRAFGGDHMAARPAPATPRTTGIGSLSTQRQAGCRQLGQPVRQLRPVARDTPGPVRTRPPRQPRMPSVSSRRARIGQIDRRRIPSQCRAGLGRGLRAAWWWSGAAAADRGAADGSAPPDPPPPRPARSRITSRCGGPCSGAKHVVAGLGHAMGGEGRAIVKGHALAQEEGRGLAILGSLGPRSGQFRRRALPPSAFSKRSRISDHHRRPRLPHGSNAGTEDHIASSRSHQKTGAKEHRKVCCLIVFSTDPDREPASVNRFRCPVSKILQRVSSNEL